MERLTMVCPVCGVDANRIIDSRPTDGGKVDRRRHECACGIRWTSRATVEPKSITNPISGGSADISTTMDGAETKRPPPTNGIQPPTNSSGGVGGGLPSGQVLVSLVSNPGSTSSVLSNPDQTRTRTRTKKQANPLFTACRNYFVRAWELAYGADCPFEPKDGIALAKMLKEHPEYGDQELWEAMVYRYLSDDFWGRKRHPLIGLATRAREFEGPAGGGVPVKVQQGRDTARNWAQRAVK